MISDVQLASKLISFPSVTPNDAGAIDYLSELLTSYGFKCEVKEFGDAQPIKNLYARYGSKQNNLCFAGHTDVVPVGDEKAWSVNPFSGAIVGEYLIGRGAVDMKAAIACFIIAAKKYIDEKQDFGSISLLITGDEEADAVNGTVKMLEHISKREKIDHCIVGEPTNPKKLGEMIKIGRRGSLTFTLQVNGVQGHVAYPDIAENPITALVKILNELKANKLDDGNDHFQPSNLEIVNIEVGNSASNVIPAKATAKFNIRFNDIHTIESLRVYIEGICNKFAPGKFMLTQHVPSECFITRNEKFSSLMVDSVQEVLAVEPILSTSGGTSDARFIKNYSPVLEFGLINETAHKVDEKAKIIDIENLTKIYYTFISKYFQNIGAL